MIRQPPLLARHPLVILKRVINGGEYRLALAEPTRAIGGSSSDGDPHRL